VTDLCEKELNRPRKTEPLKGIIDKLNKEEKVPSHIITSMLNLNSLSAYGTHPKEFDPQQVRPVLINLTTIIKWYLKHKSVDFEIAYVEPEPERTKEYKEPSTFTRSKNKSIKIVTGILLIGVIVVFSLDIFKIFNKDKFKDIRDEDGRISIAVMPFKNLTTDTLLNIWQEGLQNLLITSLSNSEGLSVRQYETMSKMIENSEDINYASLTPSIAGNIAITLKANSIIIGNIHKSGNRVRITGNLMDAKTYEIYKSFEVDGINEDDFISITDSLSKLIRNYLEIKILEQDLAFDYTNVYTSSAEAFKYFIQGKDYHGRLDYKSAIELFSKSISIDTNFVSPMLMLAYIYGDILDTEQSTKWANKAYDRINTVPHDVQLLIKEVKAAVEKRPKDQINYMQQYLQINPYSTEKMYAVGWAYYNMDQWKNAIDIFVQGIEMNEQMGSNYRLWIWQYILLGNAYCEIGEYKKAMKTYEDGLNLWPNEKFRVTFNQAICYLLQKDTIEANKYLSEISIISEQEEMSESSSLWWLAGAYDLANYLKNAEDLYRQALSSSPHRTDISNDLAYLLIYNDININEGMEIINLALDIEPENYNLLYTQGLGLFKQDMPEEAILILRKSWEARPFYSHKHNNLIQEVEQALANQNK